MHDKLFIVSFECCELVNFVYIIAVVCIVNSLESVAFHYICISVNLISSHYTFLSRHSLFFISTSPNFHAFV